MGEKAREKNVEAFGADVGRHAGYAYTGGDRLSSRWANQRLSDAIGSISDLSGCSVLDVGCGDGTYTMQLLELGPASILGVDPSEAAIECARKKSDIHGRVRFSVGNIYALSELNAQFDVAIVRGVLHHLYEPEKAIAQLLAVARVVVVVEPNGYNPVLKLIERLSRYHVEHEEKSFAPYRLRKWFAAGGARLERSFYAGLVPFFCPDWFARVLKRLEPWVERIPLLRELGCAVYVFKSVRVAGAAGLPAKGSETKDAA